MYVLRVVIILAGGGLVVLGLVFAAVVLAVGRMNDKDMRGY